MPRARNDWAFNQKIGVVGGTDFGGQKLLRQKQVGGRGRLCPEAEIAQHGRGHNPCNLKPERHSLLVSLADGCVQPKSRGLAHAQNDVVSILGVELSA